MSQNDGYDGNPHERFYMLLYDGLNLLHNNLSYADKAALVLKAFKDLEGQVTGLEGQLADALKHKPTGQLIKKNMVLEEKLSRVRSTLDEPRRPTTKCALIRTICGTTSQGDPCAACINKDGNRCNEPGVGNKYRFDKRNFPKLPCDKLTLDSLCACGHPRSQHGIDEYHVELCAGCMDAHHAFTAAEDE